MSYSLDNTMVNLMLFSFVRSNGRWSFFDHSTFWLIVVGGFDALFVSCNDKHIA